MITLNDLSRSKLLKSWPVLDGNGGGFHLRSLEVKILPIPKFRNVVLRESRQLCPLDLMAELVLKPRSPRSVNTRLPHLISI